MSATLFPIVFIVIVPPFQTSIVTGQPVNHRNNRRRFWPALPIIHMTERSPRSSQQPREERSPRGGPGSSRGRSSGRQGPQDRAPPASSDQRDRPSRRNFRDGPDSHRPQIFLHHSPSEIKLNEVQAALVKDIDEKIKALGTPKEPSREEHEKHLQEIDDEIQRLYTQRDQWNEQIRKRQSDLDALRQSRDESGSHGVNAEYQEAQRERDRLEKELHEIHALRAQKVEQLKDTKIRLGVKNQEEALARLDELDVQIETQTLTNTQLKKLLSEKDRLQSIFKSLEGVTKLQTDLEALRAQERDKRNELDAARDRFSRAREARQATQGPKDQPSPSQRINAEIREIRERLTALQEASRQKNQEKKTVREAFDAAWQEYRATLQQIGKLGYEKKVILSEAERVMMQIEEGRRRIGEIKEFVNPHEAEINAGMALIAYLEGFIEKQSERTEARAPQPKVAGSADLALVAALRKPTKKDREAAKKTQQPQKPTTLSHDMTALGQFDKVGLTAPLTIEQVAPLLEQLNAKVKAWKEAFRCARVAFNVQPDGKVVVAITVG